ncbi:MAG: hypothetical protein P8Z00_19155 [Anaerolineales bacterium]|jgi:hypothetical protein
MKATKTITLATVFSIVLLLSVTFVAKAQSNRTYFTAVEYDCLVDLGTEPWMEGNVMHMQNVLHVNVDVSDAPEFNGLNTTIADAVFNLKTGGAVIRGTLSFQPDNIAGTWEGTWIFTGNKGKGVAQAVAQGTGALFGKSLSLKLYDAEPDDSRYEYLPAMCAGIGEPESIVLIEGYILDSGKQ